MSKEKVLTKRDLCKVAWRQLADISIFNYETQLASSTLFSVYSCLWKMHPGDEDLKKSRLNYVCCYNTMPWISPFVIGAALGIEDEDGISSLDAVNGSKVSLMGPLVGIGDIIDWVMIPTISGPIAASMRMERNLPGISLWVAFTFTFLVVRTLQYERGYGTGINVITKFGKQITAFTEACSALGLTVVGPLVTTVVKPSAGLQFKNGDVVMKVQELIDGTMSVSLPVAAVGVIYYFMKVKKVKTTWMTLFIIVAFTIGATANISTTWKEGTDVEGCDLCH